MTFGEILKELDNGKVVRKATYFNSLVIFKQIPAKIQSNNILTMKSIPSDMKVLLRRYEAEVNYRDQYIIYDFADETATYAVFGGDDISATDWEVVDINTYNPYE